MSRWHGQFLNVHIVTAFVRPAHHAKERQVWDVLMSRWHGQFLNVHIVTAFVRPAHHAKE